MAPLSQANCQGNQQRKQIKNARSIQIVSNSAVQGHRLSGLDWQVTADAWWPRWRRGEHGPADEIMQFILTRKQRRYFSPFLMIRDPQPSRIPYTHTPSSPSPPSSRFHALQINLLMDDTLHALPEVAVFFSVSAPKQMPSYTDGKLSVCARVCEGRRRVLGTLKSLKVKECFQGEAEI